MLANNNNNNNFRFCSSACIRQMWPTRKRCCKDWADQRDSQQAPKDPGEAVDLASLPINELKSRLDRLRISYAGVLERAELVALLQSAI
ncbi:hypothetical protein T492DRAFT_102173 [Pavlovales sp. CCMP2436]|nr:hypothetical protein T492DRAFT_102173 [Pavlovales sp. CCMP2436]